MAYSNILPYTCLHIDCEARHLTSAILKCIDNSKDRAALSKELQNLWTSHSNSNHVLASLSVRSGLDLYLRVKQFPRGSEVIISAINIPSMVHILKEHGLKVVPLDINIEDVAPKYEIMDDLVTDRTVAILVAQLYGKLFDMEPIINFAKKHKLDVIEDCAEAFNGFQHMGHPQSDIALFSFGIIKFYTSFGGAIAKIRDGDLYEKMSELQDGYPDQGNGEYLKKVLKYAMVYVLLNCPRFMKPTMFLLRKLGVDMKLRIMKMLRGFPIEMMQKIRHQPSTALLHMMVERQSAFSMSEFCTRRVRGEYVQNRLPAEVEVVGGHAKINNYWLFPILVENPDTFVETLNAFGVYAYRGATQLNIVEPENGHATMHPAATMNKLYPHEAKYLIDHCIYIPIVKTVPFHDLDRMIKVIKMTLRLSKNHTDSHHIKLSSKL